MAIYGYGRVSRDEQTSENQRQVIELQQKIAVDEWFEDHAVSGKTKTDSRPMFSAMVAKAVKGDTIVFTRVDRIGRKASNTLVTVEGLLERGIEVYILQLGEVPLSSPMGKVMLGVFAIFAENERDSIVERTKQGLARTKEQGTKLGAPLKIPPQKLAEMIEKAKAGVNLNKIGQEYGFPRNTVERNITAWKGKLPEYAREYEARRKQYKLRDDAKGS